MAITHVFIGIGEGIATVLVVACIAAVRPGIILTMKDKKAIENAHADNNNRRIIMRIDKSNKSLLIGLAGVFTLFMVLVPVYFAFSNGLPDGLDKQCRKSCSGKKAGIYTSVWSVN